METRPMVVVVCSCGHKMKAPAAILGKTTQCVKCGAKFAVTQANSRPLDAAKDQPAAKPSTAPASPAQRRPRISRMLLDAGLVTEEQLREAEAEYAQHGGRVIDILVAKNYVSRAALSQLLNQQTGLPSIDLKNFQISPKVVSLIPRDFAFERLILPIDRVGNILTVAVAVAHDTETIQLVERMTRLRVTAMLCRLDELDEAIEKYFPTTGTEEEEDQAMWGIAPRGKTPSKSVTVTVEMPVTPEAPSAPTPTPASTPPTQPTPTVQMMGVMDSRRHDQALSRIAELSGLPASPQIAERLETISQDPHFPARDLATICATEPAVVAKMISIANAAAYGMPDKVDNAYLAGALLGTNGMIRVMKMCIPPVITAPPSSFDYDEFSLSSRFCAAVAQSVARAGGTVAFATAMTAALLYRIGDLALAVAFPNETVRVKANWTSPDRLQQELDAYGTNYPEAGGGLLRIWRVPERLAEAVRLHTFPERAIEQDPLAAIVAAAALMTAHGLEKKTSNGLHLPHALPDALKLTPRQCQDILDDTLTAFRVS